MATIDAYDTKDGRRWRVIYRKPDGTQTSRRGFQRKRDAQEWLAEHVTVAKASGTYIDPQAGRRKVGGLWPAWIAKKRVSSKASYVESLERAWRVHVEPQWGARTLESLTRAEIQEWVSAQAESKSATVVLRNLGILRGICADAVSDRLIPSNPCDGIETPRKKRKEHTYLTVEQLFRLADESGDRRTMVLVLGLCGLRWGDGRTARRGRGFRQTSAFGQTERHHSQPRGGGRPAKIRQVEAGRVPQHTRRPAARSVRREGRPRAAVPRAGRRISGAHRAAERPDQVVLAGEEARRRPLGLTYHDLRHTAASLMVSSGANVKAIQNQLGHASAAMTLDVYADLFDDDLDAVGLAMDSLLLRENVAKMLPKTTASAA